MKEFVKVYLAAKSVPLFYNSIGFKRDKTYEQEIPELTGPKLKTISNRKIKYLKKHSIAFVENGVTDRKAKFWEFMMGLPAQTVLIVLLEYKKLYKIISKLKPKNLFDKHKIKIDLSKIPEENIFKFESDDDAKLWFEMEYNL